MMANAHCIYNALENAFNCFAGNEHKDTVQKTSEKAIVAEQ